MAVGGFAGEDAPTEVGVAPTPPTVVVNGRAKVVVVVAGTEVVLLVTEVVDVVVVVAGGAVVVVVVGRVVVVVVGAAVDDVTLVDGICVVGVPVGVPGVLGSAATPVGMASAATDTSTEITTTRRPKSTRVNLIGACRTRSRGLSTRPLLVLPAAGSVADGVEVPVLPDAEPSRASPQAFNLGWGGVRICDSGIAAPGRTATCLRHTLFDGAEELLKQT